MKNSIYDDCSAFLLSCYIVLYSLNILFKTSIYIPFISDNFSYFLSFLFIFFVLYNIKKIKISVILMIKFEIYFFILILFTIIRFPEYLEQIFSRCIWTLIFCIPLYSIFSKVNNIDVVLKKTKIASIFVFLTMIYIYINNSINYFDEDIEYNMVFGYTLLYPMLLFFVLSLSKGNKIYLLTAIISLILIFIHGSRGPLLCAFMFFILYVLFSIKNSKAKSYIIKLFILFISTFIFFYYNLLVKFIIRFLLTTQISGRTINNIISGTFLADSGRISLWKIALENILKNPFFGWGVAGDKVCMEQYPHLIFLEILLHFGIIFGMFLIILIVYKIFMALYLSKFENVELILLMSSGLFPLLFSHSYLQEPLFWVFMGTSTAIARKNKLKVKN